ncbi:uncharacterized protein LOC116345074 [Contarinia nasturtii]|uniref:uncharacterized protein LOC116345074 n=1 Tax=Contarinia nasturtii TaxID=265458 RepID=UPI0012D40113|nr:uncharacterized protein LOC116345074 [Contarinia nasturtii]
MSGHVKFETGISFVKEEYDRYQSVLEPFDQIYYEEQLRKNKKTDKKDLAKLDGIVKEWSKRIENSFPLPKEMIEMVKDQMITLATAELSDLPVIKRFLNRWKTDGPYLKGLISRCERVSKRFECEFSELKEIPEAPSSSQFLTALKNEFGPLKCKNCFCL